MTSFTGDITGLPPNDACMEISSAYFNYIHDPSHNLFHRPTFMADLARGDISRPIILCILALAARFSQHPFFANTPPRLRGAIYAREAESRLDLHDASLSVVQIAVLLGAFYGTEGDSLLESIYYSVACRTACLLHLPECSSDTPLNHETSIRLWWTLEMIDVWSSNTTRLPRLLVPRTDLQYPRSDDVFLRMRRGRSDSASSNVTSLEVEAESVLVQKIKLSSLLSEIVQLNSASADGSLGSYEIHAMTDSLAKRLHDWEQSLPDGLKNTHENLATQAALGSGGAFVALHIGFHHFSQLLYYRYLHQSLLVDAVSSPSPIDLHMYAERCRESSTALCELLYAAQVLSGAEVYYSMVGHALVISSTVQLHILLFSDDDTSVGRSRKRLEKNYVILCGLQNLWRTIDHTLGRFREFHQACMQAKAHFEDERSPFRLDKWMIRFLMEYSQPVVLRTEVHEECPPNQEHEVRQQNEGRTELDMFRETLFDLGVNLERDQSWNYPVDAESLLSQSTS